MALIVGVVGKKRHGKNTFADILKEIADPVVINEVSFADALKKHCIQIFGLTTDQVYSEKLKEQPLEKEINMDEYISQMASVTNLNNIQPQGKIAKTPREVLQFYGSEYIRNAKQSYWTDLGIKAANDLGNICVITDVRFLNEAEAVKNSGGVLVRIIREDLDSTDSHISEKEQESIEADYTIINKKDNLYHMREEAFKLSKYFKALNALDSNLKFINASIRLWETTSGFYANYGFKYGEDGKKYIVAIDIHENNYKPVNGYVVESAGNLLKDALEKAISNESNEIAPNS